MQLPVLSWSMTVKLNPAWMSAVKRLACSSGKHLTKSLNFLCHCIWKVYDNLMKPVNQPI